MLRNRRTVIFTLVMPSVFFLLFGTDASYKTEPPGAATSRRTSWSAWPSTARCSRPPAAGRDGLHRACRSAGAGSCGSPRCKPVAYVAVKLVVAMTIGAGRGGGRSSPSASSSARSMPAASGSLCGLLAWVCALVFAAFGLFMGYLLPSENVMQILGPALALLSFAGGLFVPLDQMSHTFATIAKFTPVYGVGVIARYPLTDEGTLGVAILNVVLWTLVFVVGAIGGSGATPRGSEMRRLPTGRLAS